MATQFCLWRRCARGLPAALAIVVATAARADDPQGWYAGLAGKDTHVEVWRGYGWEVGPTASSYMFSGGRRLTDHFAVEFGMLRAANLEWQEWWADVPDIPGWYDSIVVFDATALQASAVGIAPFGRVWEAYAKGGYVYSRLRGQQTLTDSLLGSSLTRSISSSTVDYLLGFGLGVTVAPAWRLRAELQFFYIDNGFVAARDDATIDSVLFGVEYRFGGRKPER
jgi:hypothetical protein